MKNTHQHPIASSFKHWWILLCLSALSWLLICGWLFKTTSFQVPDKDFDQIEKETPSISKVQKPEEFQIADKEVSELKLVSEDGSDVQKLNLITEDVSKLDNPEFNAGEGPSRVQVAARPVVVHVDVSGLAPEDRVEELFLEPEVKLQEPAPKTEDGLVGENGSGFAGPNEPNPEGAQAGASEIVTIVQLDEGVAALNLEPERASLSEFEQNRQNELGVLEGLSTRIGFKFNSTQINQGLEAVLDRMFDPLYLYSEPRVFVSVSTNESIAAAANNMLSRGRGQAIIAYLVNRGLEVDRFSIFIESGDALPFGTHAVKVVPENLSQ